MMIIENAVVYPDPRGVQLDLKLLFDKVEEVKEFLARIGISETIFERRDD